MVGEWGIVPLSYYPLSLASKGVGFYLGAEELLNFV
jgi:hypothetical protein